MIKVRMTLQFFCWNSWEREALLIRAVQLVEYKPEAAGGIDGKGQPKNEIHPGRQNQEVESS